MGALVVNDDALAERLRFIQNACGATPGPQDCFLVLRGLKTLHIRMDRHQENGSIVANYLLSHPKVSQVYYPGFETHPGHDVAKKQMSGYGGMVSFTLKGDKMEDALHFMETIRLFTLAESLGGVESLCCHPASMTHASIPQAERIANGLKDTLIRLSVGIEDGEDILADLEQALS
jgi:cystathionine beta-lyase/cystathionine gamma-synthase